MPRVAATARYPPRGVVAGSVFATFELAAGLFPTLFAWRQTHGLSNTLHQGDAHLFAQARLVDEVVARVAMAVADLKVGARRGRPWACASASS